MDIVRGSLDEISRPACSGRSRPGSRVLGTPCMDKAKAGGVGVAAGSLEVLAPEPGSPEAGSEVVALAPSPTPSARGGGCQTPEEEADRENWDPQLRQAFRTMRRLDKILARKQAREREVKAQGRELSKRLWEELRAAVLPGTEPRISPEETANTSHFLALSAAYQQDGASFTPVFQTQVPCDEESEGKLSLQGARVSPQSTSRKRKGARGKKKPDFIRRNVELVKEAGSQVILLEEEKERLLELLKDTEDGGSDTPGLEEESVCERIVAGEGYTPEPGEQRQLVKIDAELQAVLSLEDFSAVRSPSSSTPSQIYQESVVNINGSQGAVPGEKILRDNREQREQISRLREIDHRLRSLECRSPDSATLSEEKLRSLLQECLSCHRSCSVDTQEGALDSARTSLSCYSTKDFPPLSKSVLSKLLAGCGNMGNTTPDMIEEDERPENEIADYYMRKAFVISPEAKMIIAELSDELQTIQEDEEEATDSSTEDSYMSEAPSMRSLKNSACSKKAYHNSDTSQLSAVSISTLAESTSGNELRIEDVTEDLQLL
ncbi:fibrous sheath-interacting protein 1 [Rhinatrema bivittatum]|uniref:fibrous sheath-interacting protein 1 n=1 Tax=Rhinatrema bivittatum TaxID=194408 RepID=UPI00112976CF|nr:fibrous sheath-interacting protein 1 [Rhinatrema bivittatum]